MPITNSTITWSARDITSATHFFHLDTLKRRLKKHVALIQQDGGHVRKNKAVAIVKLN
jgi:hypothetical protein